MSLDVLFDALVVSGSSWAGILGGFVLVLAMIFIGAKAFKESNMQLDTFGFMVLALIGAILSTALGLFPVYILLVFIIGIVAFILIKGLLFGGK